MDGVEILEFQEAQTAARDRVCEWARNFSLARRKDNIGATKPALAMGVFPFSLSEGRTGEAVPYSSVMVLSPTLPSCLWGIEEDGTFCQLTRHFKSFYSCQGLGAGKNEEQLFNGFGVCFWSEHVLELRVVL